MNLVITDEVLAMTSRERLIAVANFPHSQFIILTEDNEDLGLVTNAELVSVEDYKYSPFTATATFRVDRHAQGIPYGVNVPNTRYMNRTVHIRRITASDLVKEFGLGDTLYLGLTEVPLTTRGLASAFKTRFNLDVTEEDIVDQKIVPNAKCIILKFEDQSIAFEGAIRVDLNTPIYAPE